MLKVNIPPGVEHNSLLKVDVPNHGKIRVRVKIQPHSLVERDGYDVIIKIPITIGEAFTGIELDVPAPYGSVRVKVPPRGNSIKKLRLKGHGVKNPHNDVAGDLYVETYVVAPTSQDGVVKDAIAAIEAHYREPVRKNIPKKLTEN